MEHLLPYLDLRDENIDPEKFANALALQYVYHLLLYGKDSGKNMYAEAALQPRHLSQFLKRALDAAQQKKQFEQEWTTLYCLVQNSTSAWETGYSLFESELSERAGERNRSFALLQRKDVEDHARRIAVRVYRRDWSMQAWLENGYLYAWQQHFQIFS